MGWLKLFGACCLLILVNNAAGGPSEFDIDNWLVHESITEEEYQLTILADEALLEHTEDE